MGSLYVPGQTVLTFATGRNLQEPDLNDGFRRLVAGAGLGLYVARKIALSHGGALDLAEYEPGGMETAFFLKLPILKTEKQDV